MIRAGGKKGSAERGSEPGKGGGDVREEAYSHDECNSGGNHKEDKSVGGQSAKQGGERRTIEINITRKKETRGLDRSS